MQQGAPQERISVRQPRVQQPMVSRLNSSEDDAPVAQQQEQPRPQVRSRPAPQPRMPFGLNPVAQTSSGSESYGPVRRPRPQRPEPSFNELRREALGALPGCSRSVTPSGAAAALKVTKAPSSFE